MHQTNPASAGSVLRFTDVQSTNRNVTLRWTGGQTVGQIIQQVGNLNGPWIAILTNNPPTAITNSMTISNGVVSPRFYRIQIVR